MRQVPLAKPEFDRRELNAVRRVLETGWVVQGPEVEAFERELADLHQTQHCIVVSSGTAALHLCYLAMGIGRGHAVFIPSFAWPAAANMAMLAGARPVFVDVLPHTCNMDPHDLRVRISQSIEHRWGEPRAVVPVHEFGLAAEMDAIMPIAAEYGMEVIEDAACALGATYHDRPVGTFGKMAILSFHPRKAITTGEGGAILTNDDELAEKCRMWRNHGQKYSRHRRDFMVPGLNYRMTEIQAALGRVQLTRLPSILKKRRELAEVYFHGLTDCDSITVPSRHPEHSWQTYMVLLAEDLDREAVVRKLATKGIGTGPGSVAGHCGRLYRQQYAYKPSDLPVSSRFHRRGLALPMYSSLRAQDVGRCTSQLKVIKRR